MTPRRPTCTCRKWATTLDVDDECQVPGHGMVPAEPVALVQVGWFHGDGVNVTAFRPLRDGEPAHPERWKPVYVMAEPVAADAERRTVRS